MKPFEPATQELRTGKGLVKRSTFLRILRRIAELSGVQLAPLSRSSETASGASYSLAADASRKQWGVKTAGEGFVSVGHGCVMIQGKNDFEILSSDRLAVGRSGFVGVLASIRYEIGAENVPEGLPPEFMGWITVTNGPRLAFKSAPTTSYLSINFATSDSDAGEIFIPLAFIEEGKITDLIRDGLAIRLVEQTYIPEPIFTPVLV